MKRAKQRAANRLTYTDGDKIHFSNQGIPMVLVSIPLRYMHMPAEVVDKKRCGRLHRIDCRIPCKVCIIGVETSKKCNNRNVERSIFMENLNQPFRNMFKGSGEIENIGKYAQQPGKKHWF